ncbi:MAG: Single-stranded DNA-binding protein, partial [Anaerolineales bacterium]|nr:Single-stranded DNA-binding protein [Anaerolineales bacterium]
RMQMLGSRSGQGDASARERSSEAREPTPAGEGKSAATAKNQPAGQFSDMDDDIPF